MLKTYQFKTNCNGYIRSSKTANIILSGLTRQQRWTPLRVEAVTVLQLTSMHLNMNTIVLVHVRRSH